MPLRDAVLEVLGPVDELLTRISQDERALASQIVNDLISMSQPRLVVVGSPLSSVAERALIVYRRSDEVCVIGVSRGGLDNAQKLLGGHIKKLALIAGGGSTLDELGVIVSSHILLVREGALFDAILEGWLLSKRLGSLFGPSSSSLIPVALSV